MSEIDLEKDDKATQEMLSMMGNTTTEISDSIEGLDADDLLNALDSLPSIDEGEVEPQDVHNLEEMGRSDDPSDSIADLGLDLDDIDSLMAEANSSEDEIDLDNLDLDNLDNLDNLINTTDGLEAKSSEKDLEDINLDELTGMDNIEDTNLDIENSDKVAAELDDINLDDLENLANTSAETDIDELNIADLNSELSDLETVDSIEEMNNNLSVEDDVTIDMPETNEADNTHLEMEMESEDSIDTTDVSTDIDLTLIDQASQSVSIMEEAIDLDQSIQNIAQEVKNTAQEATQLALATSKEAQASAEKTQEAIEATFSAAERAFEAAKKAGYSVDLSSINNNQSNEEIASQLAEIQEKNTHLKSVNESIKARIADMKAE